ncbi:WD40 repeat domain-containing protein [Nonomuraea sp. B19D2]|uniref:WD40 repeat domain-containing protein n=1 Tax=Nonomuraea sp. B19D2 TaxID=3159561 RepID=UPI0032D9C93D
MRESDVGELTLLHSGDHRLHDLFADLRGAPDGAPVRALRALAGLGLALIAESAESAAAALRSAVGWLEQARSSPPADPPPWTMTTADPRLQRCLDLLTGLQTPEAVKLTAATFLSHLTGPPAARRAQQEIGVLFAYAHGRGAGGRLRASILPGGPPGLVPDPARMSLFSGDEDFATAALGRAWSVTGAQRVAGTVLWSLEGEAGPILHVRDASLGAAFAAVLHEIRRATTRLGGLRVRRLRADTFITGRLGSQDELASVGGYQAKLAASKAGRVIVPIGDRHEAEQHTQGADIVPAVTWRAATRLAYRYDRRRLARLVAAAAIISTLLAFAGVRYFMDRAQDEARLALSREVTDEAGKVRATDPVLAGLLSAAAWETSPTDAARHCMRAMLATGLEASIPAASKVSTLEVSPDGATLAVGGDRSVQLRDLRTGATDRTLTGNDDFIRTLGFADSGRTLVAADQKGTVCAWRTTDGLPEHECLRISRAHTFAFSADGRLMAAGDLDGRVHVLNLRTWKLTERRVTERTAIDVVAFTPDSRTLVVGATPQGELKSALHFFAPESWKVTRKRVSYKHGLTRLAFKSDGRTAVALSGNEFFGYIELWDMKKEPKLVRRVDSPALPLDISISPDGATLAVADIKGDVRYWETDSLQQRGPALKAHLDNPVRGVRFANGGRTIVTGGEDGFVRRWSARSVTPDATARIDTDWIGYGYLAISSTFTQDGETVAVGGRDGDVYLWDQGKSVTVLDGHTRQVDALAAPGGRTLITAGDAVRLRDLSTPKDPGQVLAGSEGVTSVAVSPDGTLVAGATREGRVTVWRLPSGQPAFGPFEVGEEVLPLALSFGEDGTTLAVSGVESAQLWDLGSGKPAGGRMVFAGRASAAAFGPGARSLAVGTNNGNRELIEVWDTATGKHRGEPLDGATTKIEALAFNPDGTVLASGDTLDGLTLWDVAARERLGLPLSTTLSVSTVAFDPGGTAVAAVSDRTVYLWRTGFPPNLVTAVCAAAGRSLTRAEWERHLPGEEYRKICG